MRAILCLLFLASTSRADDPAELLKKADDALKARRPADAAKLLDDAIKAAPKSLDAYRMRAVAREQLKQFDGALADLNHFLKLKPDSVAALDLRGIVYFKLAKPKESLADFDRAIQLRPDLAAAHWRRGLTLYYANEFGKGVAQFTTSDKAEPEDVENAIWHFLCNVRVKGLEKARAEMLRVARDPRGDYMMKAYDLFRGKAEAKDVFAAAETGNVDAEERKVRRFYAHYYVGMYYESMGQPAKSLPELRTAVEKYPISHYMMDVANAHLKLRTQR